jgi:hypothetical protein
MYIVQHLQFAFPTIPEKLFYTGRGGEHACQVKEDGLHLTAYGRQASLDLTTLFNSFPAEHFLTNTRAQQVYLQLHFSGQADSITVYRKTQWNDETVHRQLDPAAGDILLGPFPLEKNTKRYAFSIETHADIILHAGCWLVDAEPQDKSVDICITTFKKEHYVTANVSALLAYPPLTAMNYRITVVDNGSTLGADDFPHADNFTLIRQANLGGTGGFMRGLLDARDKQSDYILFMDDDILLVPEMIYRAVAIAQIAKPKRAFGGMMLHYTRKDKIHEQGGRLPWKIHNFFQAINDDAILKKTQQKVAQEALAASGQAEKVAANSDLYAPLYSEGHPDFSGWWFYMAETCDTPILPNYFFKWDDICSSLYLRQRGTAISVFPTIFVWHEDFSIKRHLMMTDYLSMRNEVLAFAFLNIPAKQMKIAFRRTFAMIVRDILMYDYRRAEIRLKALHDALDYRRILSPQFVADGHGDYPVKLAREYMPVLTDIDNNIDTFYEQEKARYPRGTFIKRALRMMLASIRLIIPWKKAALSNGKIPLLSMDNGNFPIIYPYQQYFLYNPDGSTGYYCTYSGKKTRELLWQTWKTVRQVRAAYPQIAAYMQTQPFDEAYWQRIFQPQPRQNGENS